HSIQLVPCIPARIGRKRAHDATGVPQPAQGLERHRRIYPFEYDAPGEGAMARSAMVDAGPRAPVRVSGRRSPTECKQGGRRPVGERAEEFSPPEAKADVQRPPGSALRGLTGTRPPWEPGA